MNLLVAGTKLKEFGCKQLLLSTLQPIPLITKRKTGICSVCCTRLILREDGSLSAHVIKAGEECKGTGAKPVDKSVSDK